MKRKLPAPYAPWLASTTAQRYGAAVQALAVTLIAYAITHSTVTAGALGTVRGIIATLIVIPGGVIVDRADRRRLMLTRGIANIVVWGIGTALFLAGALHSVPGFWIFATLVICDALIEGLFGGAAEAALRSLLSGNDYVRARAINEARDASAQLLGSPISGALFSLWQFGPIVFGLIADAVATVCAFLLPSLAPNAAPADAATPDQPASNQATPGQPAEEASNNAQAHPSAQVPDGVGNQGSGPTEDADPAASPTTEPGADPAEAATNPAEHTSIWKQSAAVATESFSGFSWVAGHRVVLGLSVICALASLGSFLFISLAQLYLVASGQSAIRVGLVATAEGVGILAGSSLAVMLTSKIPGGRILIGSLLWMSLFLVPAVIWEGNYSVLLVCAFLYALMAPALNASLGGYIFQIVPPHLQGRVGAAESLIVGLPVAGASLIAGAVLAATGLRMGLMLAIALTLICALIAVAEKPIRSIPTPDQW